MKSPSKCGKYPFVPSRLIKSLESGYIMQSGNTAWIVKYQSGMAFLFRKSPARRFQKRRPLTFTALNADLDDTSDSGVLYCAVASLPRWHKRRTVITGAET